MDFCLFTKARYTAVRYEFPSGKMHLSILTSVFYIIPIPTSLFLLTFASLHLSIDTNRRTDSSLVVFQVTCSPKQEPKLRLLSLRKPLGYHTKPGTQSKIRCHLCSPHAKPCHGALGQELCFYSASSSR